MLTRILVILSAALVGATVICGQKCNLCIKGGLIKKYGVSDAFVRSYGISNHTHSIWRRSVDPTFRGNPKTQAEVWSGNFQVITDVFDQSASLINLLNKIAAEYLNKCPPFILYDTFVENSALFILQNLFQTFPITFYHGKINEYYILENRYLMEAKDYHCRSFILFLSDPLMARQVIGPQIDSKVILVARSSQWKLEDFLTSELSSDIVNLLVIGESLSADARRERPYVLYTHQLYADGLGANVPVVLTTWARKTLSRPHINLFPQKFSEGFAGHRFIVTAVNQPPYIFRTKFVDTSGTVNIAWEGVEYRLLDNLSKRLNFSFEIVEPKNAVKIGSGEAVKEDVQFGRADIGMAGAYITLDRLEVIDMSVGHSKDCAAFITLASKALPKYRAIMGPFQWQVWVSLTAIYLLGIFPLAYSDRLTLRHLIGNVGEIENMFWYVFGTFTNSLSFSGKFSWSNTKKLSTRLLIGFYWLFTIIITACYTGSIIAFVTLPAFPDTVDSVNDLLGLFFRVSTLDKGGWERWFANSTHEATSRLYNKMEFVGTIEEGVGNVTKSFFWNYAFLGSKSQLEYLVQSNFTDENMSKRSALHLSEECFALFQIGLTFPRNAVYANRINEFIMRMQQGGLINKLFNEVSWKMQRTTTGRLLQASSSNALKEIIREERQLTTADTEGMFLLMGCGYLIAALALISEVIGGFSNKCRQIVRRSRKSNSSSSTSHRNSGCSELETDIKDHFEGQTEHHQHSQPKSKGRFPGLSGLKLTRDTLKELYGGYRRKESNIIFQNGQIILESEAMSENSSIIISDNSVERITDDRSENFDDPSFNHEVVIHGIPNDDEVYRPEYDENFPEDSPSNDFIEAPVDGYTSSALEKIDELNEKQNDVQSELKESRMDEHNEHCRTQSIAQQKEESSHVGGSDEDRQSGMKITNRPIKECTESSLYPKLDDIDDDIERNFGEHIDGSSATKNLYPL